MPNFDDKIVDLRLAQGKTHTLVQNLTDKVDKFIERDDVRQKDYVDYRVESSKRLAEVATIVRDMKKEVDCAINVTIPAVKFEQAAHCVSIKHHGWFMKSVIVTTLLAVLGGAVTTMTTCDRASAADESMAVTDGGISTGRGSE